MGDKDGSYCKVRKFEKEYSYKLDFRSDSNRQTPTKVITSEITDNLLVDGCIIRLKNVVAEMHLKHNIHILYNKA